MQWRCWTGNMWKTAQLFLHSLTLESEGTKFLLNAPFNHPRKDTTAHLRSSVTSETPPSKP